MTDTANLGLPFIEGSQAQKHVTHNEALRILDAVIQVAVLDANRTAPPASPADGDRHIVAASPTGAWSGHAFAIATREDGAWRFLVPSTGWIAWSADDDILLVFDGSVWRSLSDLPSAVAMFGVNTTADSTNKFTVRSNAVLLTDLATADGGSGDVRLQLSKQASGNTASVVFSNAFSGRAEFGLVGSDAFRLKVSPDGSSFVDGFTIDQASGNLTLPRGLALSGVISPAQITANQNDYAPAGLANASVLRISTDAARDVTGLASGADGRVVMVCNCGAFNAVLKAESASSAAANRFGFGSDLTLAAKQGTLLIYDAAASRWRQIGAASGAGGAGTVTSVTIGNGLTGTANPLVASGDIRIDATFLRGYIAGLTLANNASDAVNDIDIAPGVATADNLSAIIKLAAAMTKRLDAAWSVGTGNGGLDTGSIANTTYHVWLIQRSDTGVVDVLFSASASFPTMPANYDRKRRIGSIVRASGAILAFSQQGDQFLWKSPPMDWNATNPGTSSVTRTLTVPTGIQVAATITSWMFSSINVAVAVYLSSFEQTDLAAATAGPFSHASIAPGDSTSHSDSAVVVVRTNTSGQVRMNISASDASTQVRGITHGYQDARGRFD